MDTAFRQALTRYASRDVDLASRKGGGFSVTVACVKCGSPKEAMTTGTLLNPQTIASRLRQRGWQIGHRNLCPEHKTTKRKTAVTTQTPPPTSDKAREAKRLAMMSLDEYFNSTTGQYCEGKNDSVIGKDCDLAVTVVANLREEFYGSLRAPTEFERLLADARAHLTALETARSEAQATISKLDRYAVAQGWA